MAVIIPSSKSDGKCHIRSISLPCRSHPSTLQLEAELNKLRSLETSPSPSPSPSSSDAICCSLSGLEKLYNCMDDLLNLKSTIEALSHQQNEPWVNDLMDSSLELLDVCSSTRVNMFQIKELVRDLQSAMRRRKGDLSLERSIGNYVSFRKKMKKDAKKLIASLKQNDHKFDEASLVQDRDNHHLCSLFRVLREVTMASISVFESMLLFISAPSSNSMTATKWSLVSRLIEEKAVACEDLDLNDFTNADSALCSICKSSPFPEFCSEKMQLVHKKMVALESSIESIESGLECIFRRLVKTRAFFLNIISQ